MEAVRHAFLDAAAVSAELVGAPEVARGWGAASALAALSVGALAAHLARATVQVEVYLDAPRPDPGAEAISAGRYYARLAGPADLGSPLNVGVRHRADQLAARGHRAVLDDLTGALERLRVRLPGEPPDRRLEALGQVLTLDDYLRTRLVELTVHVDDLAASVGRPPPDMPETALDGAVGTLVETAVVAHGHLRVLRALARREREASDILTVL